MLPSGTGTSDCRARCTLGRRSRLTILTLKRREAHLREACQECICTPGVWSPPPTWGVLLFQWPLVSIEVRSAPSSASDLSSCTCNSPSLCCAAIASKWASAASLDFLSSFCGRSRRNRNALVTPPALESVSILRGFLGLLAILGNESLVIPNQTGDLLLLNHERLPQDTSCCIWST